MLHWQLFQEICKLASSVTKFMITLTECIPALSTSILGEVNFSDAITTSVIQVTINKDRKKKIQVIFDWSFFATSRQTDFILLTWISCLF